MGNGEGDPGGEAATGRTSNIVLDLVSPGVCGIAVSHLRTEHGTSLETL